MSTARASVDARATRTPDPLIEPRVSMSLSMHATAHAASFASRRGGAMGSRVRARAPLARAVAPRRAAPLRVVAEDFPKPDKIDKTDNYRQGAELSQKFKVRDPSDPRPHRPGREPSALPAPGTSKTRGGTAMPSRGARRIFPRFRPPPRASPVPLLTLLISRTNPNRTSTAWARRRRW